MSPYFFTKRVLLGASPGGNLVHPRHGQLAPLVSGCALDRSYRQQGWKFGLQKKNVFSPKKLFFCITLFLFHLVELPEVHQTSTHYFEEFLLEDYLCQFMRNLFKNHTKKKKLLLLHLSINFNSICFKMIALVEGCKTSTQNFKSH